MADAGERARVGRLLVVATPIGNLDDLTPRAARALAEADLVAAEDTRVTGKLLARIGCKPPMISYREETERREAPRLIERLRAGTTVALVSDAGTPCISDPGYRLVRAAAEAGVEVVPIPGPSAVVALLSAAGLATDRFSFEGFAPSKASGRRRLLAGLAGAGRTVVFYESPRRLAAFLEDVAGTLDDPFVAVGRELTKLYEEIVRGRASELAARWHDRPPKGEVVVAIEVAAADSRLDGPELVRAVRALAAEGRSARDIAAALKPRGASRKRVYDILRDRQGGD